jgi:hypothetical protein
MVKDSSPVTLRGAPQGRRDWPALLLLCEDTADNAIMDAGRLIA